MAASTNCFRNPVFYGRFSVRKPLPKALNLSTRTAITSVNNGFSKRLCPPIKLIPQRRIYEKFSVTNHLSGDEPEIEPKQPDFLPFPLVSMHADSSETILPVKVGGPEPETACDSGDVCQGVKETGEVYEINESSLFLTRIIFLWVLAYFYLNEKTQFGIRCGSEEVICEKYGPIEMKNGYGLKVEIDESSLFLNRVILLWVMAFILNDKKQIDILDVLNEGCGSEVVVCEKCGTIEMKNYSVEELKGEKDAGHNGGILRSLVSAIPFSTWIVIFSLSYLMSYSKAEILGIVATWLKNYICWWREPKVFSAEWCGKLFMKYHGFIHSLADKIILYLPQIVSKKYRSSFGLAFLFWVASFAAPILCIILVCFLAYFIYLFYANQSYILLLFILSYCFYRTNYSCTLLSFFIGLALLVCIVELVEEQSFQKLNLEAPTN